MLSQPSVAGGPQYRVETRVGARLLVAVADLAGEGESRGVLEASLVRPSGEEQDLARQLVNQFQVGQLQPGRSLLAAVDPANRAAIWLDFGNLR